MRKQELFTSGAWEIQDGNLACPSSLANFIYLFDELKPSLPVGLIMRESIPRQVDKKSGVPEEEKGVPNAQGGERDKLSFYIALS